MITRYFRQKMRGNEGREQNLLEIRKVFTNTEHINIEKRGEHMLSPFNQVSKIYIYYTCYNYNMLN